MFDHWLIMQLIAITRCQKSAKNPMQKPAKNPTKTPKKPTKIFYGTDKNL